MSWGSFALGLSVGAAVAAPLGVWVGFRVMAGVIIEQMRRR